MIVPTAAFRTVFGLRFPLVGDWENKIVPVHPRHRRRLAEALGIPRGQEPWDPSAPWVLEDRVEPARLAKNNGTSSFSNSGGHTRTSPKPK